MAADLVALAIAITIPFVIACAVSFGLRMYSRIIIAKNFGLDDYMMVAAFIFWIGQQAITYSWIRYGAGRHIADVSNEDVIMLKTYLLAEEFYYLFVQLLIKFSFLLFYLRFLAATRFRYYIYATMGLVTVQVVGTWVFYALQCRPFNAYLHPELYPNYKCLSSGIAYYAPTAANVLVDMIIYTLPIRPLWKLQATRRKRLNLIAVMTLGGCTILVSSLRMIVLWELATQADFTYIFGRVVTVTTIEFVTAIVTANMPAMKTIWSYHSDKNAQPSHELGNYGFQNYGNTVASSGKESDGGWAGCSERFGAAVIERDAAVGRVPSPTESQVELVGGKAGSVVVTSEWQVTSNTKSGLSSKPRIG